MSCSFEELKTYTAPAKLCVGHSRMSVSSRVSLQVGDYLNEYAAKFWVAKQPRKLVWMKHLGIVELSLTVHGSSRDFTVPPFEASILMQFQVILVPAVHLL